jgi:hypothetical protein
MKNKPITYLAPVLLAIGVCQFSGCIIAGTSLIPPEERIISNWDFGAVGPGSTIEVSLFSGKRETGVFRGLTSLAEGKYAQKYSQALDQYSAAAVLPALGDKIAIEDTRGKVYEGEFMGFDQGSLCAKLPEKEQPARVNLRMVKEIRCADGKISSPNTINNLISQGRIPFRSAMVLDTEKGRNVLPLDEVSSALIKTYVRRTGAAVAAGSTALIFAIVAIPLIVLLGSLS